MPVWEALGKESLPEECSLGSLDVTTAPALAERFEVYGYPTLLLLEPREAQMFEFQGERSVEALKAFLNESHPQGFRTSTARRLPREPSRWDPLLDAPWKSIEIVRFAMQQGLVAMLLPVLGCMVVGAIAARLTISSAPMQFIMVRCPQGVTSGQPFQVEIHHPHPRFWWRQHVKKVMTVIAPPGIVAGQEFFVPLLKRPALDAVRSEGESNSVWQDDATESSNSRRLVSGVHAKKTKKS